MVLFIEIINALLLSTVDSRLSTVRSDLMRIAAELEAAQ
jgi:hypothetical protein